jgi:hypothetical protein
MGTIFNTYSASTTKFVIAGVNIWYVVFQIKFMTAYRTLQKLAQ